MNVDSAAKVVEGFAHMDYIIVDRVECDEEDTQMFSLGTPNMWMFYVRLTSRGWDVFTTRWPGGGPRCSMEDPFGTTISDLRNLLRIVCELVSRQYRAGGKYERR